jgi:guanine deaminase
MNVRFMREAINEALKSDERLRCGVVIVKDKRIIAKAHNDQNKTCSPAGHAEINALARAGKKLRSKRLEGCEIYCTCEPCVMCLSAIMFSHISKLYYGLTLKEVSDPERMINIDLNYFLKKSPRHMTVVKNYLEKECKKTMWD